MTQREKIDLLENFSTYLAANGYMDDDWRSEPPYAIDEFLKLTTPLLDKEEPVSEGEKWQTVIPENQIFVGYNIQRTESGQDNYVVPKLEEILKKHGWHERTVAPSIIHAMQEYAQAQRLQARNLVFENNKPVSDHVNETFEGLNSLIGDTEVVWWYKELIVQTVLHFTLQEREKAIQECILALGAQEMLSGRIIAELEDLKNNP